MANGGQPSLHKDLGQWGEEMGHVMQATVLLPLFASSNSYNPFEGPNENPEAELPLTAGEYIYVYGTMDEDGFFEGRKVEGSFCLFSCF